MTLFHKWENPEIAAAYLENESEQRLRVGKVASVLVMVLMPAGALDDFVMYGGEAAWLLLGLRLTSSVLAGVLLWLHFTDFGKRHYKVLGPPIALLPAAVLCMIMVNLQVLDHKHQLGINPYDIFSMPYYAGINLVLLAISVVVRWDVFESLGVVFLVIGMFTGVCYVLDGPQLDGRYIFNAFYFLVLTGIIVVTGNYFFDRLLKSEFQARYLERISKAKVEEKTTQLQKAIEELERTQAELVEADRVRTQARIGGFIVHNIGNALNAQINSLYALKKRAARVTTDVRPELESAIDRVDVGLSRIAETIQAMHMLAYPETKSRTEVSITEVVRMAVLLTDYRWLDESVEIEQDLEEVTVLANRQLLVDALVNLLLNSLDALKEKTFEGGETKKITFRSRQEGDRCILSLRDNGPGIPEMHRARVFERSFTTKAEGKGTGQGLASCRHTVDAFGGTISLESEEGKFCQFTLTFPVLSRNN